MNDRGAPSVPREASPPAERVSVLAGDRVCVRCGFNLTGQVVVREPHYSLLIVVCPECGSPAALQEYPLLGKWAGRLAGVTAAAWLLFMVLLVAGSAGAVFGFSRSAAESAGTRFAGYVAERQHDWATKESAAAAATSAGPPAPGAAVQPAFNRLNWILSQQPGPFVPIDTAWWKDQDAGAMLGAAGGWWGAMDYSFVLDWIGSVIPMLVIGCVWAVALTHVRRRRLWLVIPWVMLVSALFIALEWYVSPTGGPWRFVYGGGYIMAMTVGQRVYFFPLVACTFLVNAVLIWAGLMVGRPLARATVRALLAPRLRAPFSFLWIIDGKELPRGGPRA